MIIHGVSTRLPKYRRIYEANTAVPGDEQKVAWHMPLAFLIEAQKLPKPMTRRHKNRFLVTDFLSRVLFHDFRLLTKASKLPS